MGKKVKTRKKQMCVSTLTEGDLGWGNHHQWMVEMVQLSGGRGS